MQSEQTLIRMEYDTTIVNMKWVLHMCGASQDASDLLKNSPTSFGMALIVVRRGEPLGTFNFDALDNNGEDDLQNSPIYSLQDNVLTSGLYQSNGYKWHERFEQGFFEGEFYGPLKLNRGDRLVMVTKGVAPIPSSPSKPVGFMVGTVSYSENMLWNQ